jgi:hypothetical protein
MPEEKKPTQMSVAKSTLQKMQQQTQYKTSTSPVETGGTSLGYLGLIAPLAAGLATPIPGDELLAALTIASGLLTAKGTKAEKIERPTQQLGEVLGMPYPWTQMSTKLTPTPTAQPPAVTQTTSPGAQTMVTTQAIKKAVETKLPSEVSLGGTPSPISTAVETRIPTETKVPTRPTEGGAPATPAREISTPTQISGIPVEAIRRMAAERGVVPSTLFVPEGLPIEARPRVIEEELKRILGRKRGRG